MQRGEGAADGADDEEDEEDERELKRPKLEPTTMPPPPPEMGERTGRGIKRNLAKLESQIGDLPKTGKFNLTQVT